MDSSDEDLYNGFENVTTQHPNVAPPSAFTGSTARPMTSNRAAGYSSQKSQFDPLNQTGNNSSVPRLLSNEDEGTEFEVRKRENKIHKFIENSTLYRKNRKFGNAIETAKDACNEEDSLTKYREKHNLHDQINPDLGFGIRFNLATQLESNHQNKEALTTYSNLTKQRYNLPDISKVRVNMGNVYYKTGKYVDAISMYRRGVDSINADFKFARQKNSWEYWTCVDNVGSIC